LITRRQAVSALLCAGMLPVPSRANSSATAAPAAVREVAAGIFIRRGVDEDATAANDDAIANIGFVTGRDSVAVIDPGGCLHDGERLRAAIRSHTPLPIRYVIMTHVHPDHIFGAGAFQRDRPQFIGHQRLAQALAARGEYYRHGLEQILGPGRAGPVVAPTRLVGKQDEIDLGGRQLQLTAHGVAHSDCDLTVLEPGTGTLFAGDLLFVERVPSLDGSLKGWLTELNSLKTVAARRAVPGHGPAGVDWPSGSAALERYLGVLLDETRQAIRKGTDLAEAVKTVGRSERSRWKLFDAYQGHNVTQAYKELEWE